MYGEYASYEISNSVLLGGKEWFCMRPEPRSSRSECSYVQAKVPDGRQWIWYKMQPSIFKHLRFDQTFFTYKNKGNS